MPLSVIMIDIDNFKKVNDDWGHDVGDRTLVATAGIIRGSLRRGDTCARIGGEEFLVICPNTDAMGAFQVAKRICKDMSAASFDNVRSGVTVSLGAATTGPHVPSIDALLKAADEAVYSAKRAGRNRVVQAPRPEERAA
jgi:diguanylate cyclase (GGDEF)-like protein